MKFNVPSKTLYSLTSAVSKVINSKNALTILNNFLFTLKGNTLEVTGSDVDNALSAHIEVFDADGEGTFCLDARRLVDLLKEMADVPLQVTINDETLEVEIESASGVFQMVAIPGDQFPQYQKEEDSEEPVTFQCPAEQMLKGIDNTLFAIGTDDFHPQMMGILLDIHPDDITFVATDTRKLVRYTNGTTSPGVTARCILPLKPATVIKGIFDKDDTLTVTLTAKSATISNPIFTFNCRFIKGNFPDYTRVIPKNNPYTLRVNRIRFLNSVRRVGVFVDPGFGLEKFKITNEKIYLKSKDANLNREGNEVIDCEYEGPDMVIGFSAPFLIEICNVLQTEEIIARLADPSRPVVFSPTENEENCDLLMLLMPMNVVDF